MITTSPHKLTKLEKIIIIINNNNNLNPINSHPQIKNEKSWASSTNVGSPHWMMPRIHYPNCPQQPFSAKLMLGAI
jgi:hypothetical protein